MRRRVRVLPLCLFTLSGCATSPPPQTAATASHEAPLNVHWFRDSAEQKAVYLETYRAATLAARTLSHGLSDRSWGVILDIDETVLDNSDFEKDVGDVFDPKLWDAWIERRAATALPGAKPFIDTVRDDLHGQVVLVTNRRQEQCSATEDNLHSQGVHYDRILCNPIDNSDKNPRFEAVEHGRAGDAPPLNVLIWIGDNIQDFPALSQHSADFENFGVRYFALPNPMYGSWMKVPYR